MVPHPELGDRAAAVQSFLDATAWRGAQFAVLADDASFRRYFRVTKGGRRAVLMDAPPDKEATVPFARIADFLTERGFSAPKVLAHDPGAGFLLLEDLGDDTYTRMLARGANEWRLYERATDLLVALQHAASGESELHHLLSPYDTDAYLREVELLTDWYWPTVKGTTCPEPVKSAFLELWRTALTELAPGGDAALPESIVLRDYHVDNLMWLSDRDGLAACGLLDFQDALVGPVSYDLVSLLEDARRDVPDDLAAGMKNRFLAANRGIDPTAFARSYATLGVQRSTKIVGIFTRLDRRDGKPGYLRHIERIWRWIERGLVHPELAALRDWYDVHFPPHLRVEPPPLEVSK